MDTDSVNQSFSDETQKKKKKSTPTTTVVVNNNKAEYTSVVIPTPLEPPQIKTEKKGNELIFNSSGFENLQVSQLLIINSPPPLLEDVQNESVIDVSKQDNSHQQEEMI
jgi:hypothetical protein